ncbi:unnamed protein product [Nippostrongylus brasiliensis]|uniref:Cystatin domain-containing protein n=1 Tax=Nippostrongylus brasiliensis TaxID=27835 RepID=A0A0N4Y4T0_NIPBR|nr:unnamed protein product [Nippostrongylus brasiliensis]
MKSVVCLLLLATVCSCSIFSSKPKCKSGNHFMGNEYDLPKNVVAAIQRNEKAKATLENGMALVLQITEDGNTFYVADVASTETGRHVHLKLSSDFDKTEALDEKKFEKYTHCKEA